METIYVGIGLWKVAEFDLWEQFEWAGEQGFDAVMFHTTPRLPGAQTFDPDKATDRDVERLRSALSAFAESHIHAPFGNIHDTSLVTPNRYIRKASVREITRSIELAREVGVSTVTIHSGMSSVKMEPQEQKRHISEALLELDEIASSAGVLLGIEVADYFMEGQRYKLLDELQLRSTGITLDVGHISFNNGRGYREFGSIGGFIEQFRSRIFHLHIHDYDGERDHIAIGRGFIDFVEILRALKKIHYTGTLCLELNPELVTIEEIVESKERIEAILERS